MNKKQKKMLTRIVIAAAMLIALHFPSGDGAGAAGVVSGCLSGHRL